MAISKKQNMFFDCCAFSDIVKSPPSMFPLARVRNKLVPPHHGHFFRSGELEGRIEDIERVCGQVGAPNGFAAGAGRKGGIESSRC